MDYTTESGKTLTEAEIQALADEAEAGYNLGPCQEWVGTRLKEPAGPKDGVCNAPGYEVEIPFFGLRILCAQHRLGWGMDLKPTPLHPA